MNPHEQIETIANHGALCKQIKSDKKKTSSNQPCGRDSENIIGAFLKSFSIFCTQIRPKHFVGPDLGQNCLQKLSADDTRRSKS